MNIHAVDWRIESLHDVIVGIDAGLAAIHEHLALSSRSRCFAEPDTML